ncbi:MAG: TM1812 family CRISPR-associated protein, partial [Thermoprotei archaeon]
SFTEDFRTYTKVWLASKFFSLEKSPEVEREKVKEFIRFIKHDGLKYSLLSRTIGVDLERIEDHCDNQWRKLGELFTRKVGDFDKQNFLAHAGLEYNVTEIRKEDNKIKLRYDMNYKEKIINACIEGLFK